MKTHLGSRIGISETHTQADHFTACTMEFVQATYVQHSQHFSHCNRLARFADLRHDGNQGTGFVRALHARGIPDG